MISYIIATTAVATRNAPHGEEVLAKTIANFVEWLEKKKEQHIPNTISEVLLVCPPVAEDLPVYARYYRFDEWKPQLQAYGVDLRIIPYEGENQYYSYDQWIQGIGHANPQSEYFLVTEDDYCLNPNEPRSDLDVVEYYQRDFPDGIGYLASVAEATNHFSHHASVSNGLIHRKTVDKFEGNMLTEFHQTIRSHGVAQFAFSRIFLEHHIAIKDIRKRYSVFFWDSHLQRVRDLSLHPNYPHFLLPVQILFKLNIE